MAAPLRWTACSLLFAFLPCVALSAIPDRVKSIKAIDTKSALQLPLQNRIEALREQGPQGYRNLVAIMFDEKAGMESRWRAVTAVGIIAGDESKPELERALKSSEWYMRNAALVAMSAVNRDNASQWARRLLDDKALVVRAAAVQSLLELRDSSSVALLWKKLYAPENFKNSESLFIRKRIVESLAQLEKTGAEKKFIEVLADKDEALHAPAIMALEKITEQKLGNQRDTLRVQRERWRSWWSDKAQM